MDFIFYNFLVQLKKEFLKNGFLILAKIQIRKNMGENLVRAKRAPIEFKYFLSKNLL